MSKIALTPNASGSGTFTIASPNSDTDRVLTLPDEAGTVLTSGGAIDVNASAPADSLSIDADGVVTRSVIPAFRITRSASETGLSTGTNNLGFTVTNNASQNAFMDGGFTLSGDAIVVVPKAGLYQFAVSARFDGVGSGYIIMRIVKNDIVSGPSESVVINGSPDGDYESLHLTALYKCEVNDELKVQAIIQSDTSWTLNEDIFFSGFLVG